MFKPLLNAFIVMIAIIVVGSAGFVFLEDLSLFDAMWLTVITVLTIGYGDLVPVTQPGKIFAMIIVPFSIGLATYAISVVSSMMIEGELSNAIRRRRMKKQIDKLKDHIIVCGIGRVGEQVLMQLQKRGIETVIIEQNEETLANLSLQNIPYIIGDATDDQVLLDAGIERASGLVATLPKDANNVFITLTAKGLNPSIQIVARAERPQSEEKLRRAGATKVINPSSIGGKQMVMSILKPVSVEYVDMVLQAGKKEFGIEEIIICDGSKLVDLTIADSQIRKMFGVTIVGILRNNEMISNPEPNETINTGDVVIVFGSSEQLEQFEKVTRGDT